MSNASSPILQRLEHRLQEACDQLWGHVVDPYEPYRDGDEPWLTAAAPSEMLAVELFEAVDAEDFDKRANELRFDPDNDAWVASGPQLQPVAALNAGVHLPGERLWAWYDKRTGMYLLPPSLNIHLGTAESEIEAGAKGPVRVQHVLGDDAVASDLTVEAQDWLGRETPAGAKVFVFQHQQSRRWFLWRDADTAPPESEAPGCCDPNLIYQQIDEVLADYGMAQVYDLIELTEYDNDTGSGTAVWLDVTNVGADNPTFATPGVLTGATTTYPLVGVAPVDYEPTLTFLPKVIYLTIDRHDEAGSGLVYDHSIRLVIDGVPQEENLASETPWPAESAPQTYRFTTPDLTREQSLAVDFGVAIQVKYIGTIDASWGIDQANWGGDILAAEYEYALASDTTSSGPPAVSMVNATGGNPGSNVSVSSSFDDGEDTWIYIFNTDQRWNPALQGPVLRFDTQFDGNSISVGASGGPHLIRYRFAVRQNGAIFQRTAGARLVGGGWMTFADTELTAGDFTPVDGGALDLSAGGAPLEFGFAVGATGIPHGAGTGAFNARVDNFQVNVVTGDPPGEPQIRYITLKINGVEEA